MQELPKVIVSIARCRGSRKSFGIRIEEKYKAQWIADWAFSIPENKAVKEGYDRTEIRGSFAIDAAHYPGCPHCHAPGFFKCGCGKIACWDGEGRLLTCPWCGATGEIKGVIESMNTENDR
ncbi:MAG: hypothetical protein NTW32_07240 [Chloroflexi bacterium]|nr:hypothetical protein [Chloroflexota bacterium]